MASIDDILNKKELQKEDIIRLLTISDADELAMLFKKADDVRRQHCGDEVGLRGIIEFSNYCAQDCLYCGNRISNHELSRYRMEPEEIIQAAKMLSNGGIRTIALHSGEDFTFDTDMIAYIIYSIKKSADVSISLSLGERNFDEYKTWKYAGADKYLLKYETSNPKLYSIYHSKQELSDRVHHLYYLKSIGYNVGSGNIIGLPSQVVDDIANDILLCKEIEADFISFSPFIPTRNTPYQLKRNGSVDMTLKAIAVARIVLKTPAINATAALASLDNIGRERALTAGANLVMPNFTPSPYREKLLIYPDERCLDSDPAYCGACIEKKIASSYFPSFQLSTAESK
ncbi:MAG TPA: [FeFe] hydrogenase H-cluster radical SAM maturase HydE [Ignavibacteriales bacterium]|nr:[FeFe] hydrogenase H-cluster radical SAM maturase HydE [Ignavibacteriales bacterium]